MSMLKQHAQHLTCFHRGILLVLLPLLLVNYGCDSIEPSQDNLMVVEGFLNAEAPFPDIRITKAIPLDQGLDKEPEAINDASLRIFIDGAPVPYGPSSEAGVYKPLQSLIDAVPAGATFRAEIEWQSQTATITDIIPPPILIDSVSIKIPDAPVAAILVDTLRLDSPQVGARKGFIYPIDVTITWQTSPLVQNSDSEFWIETRLIPQSDFSSTVLDVFLLTEEVQKEDALESSRTVGDDNDRTWSGVYAIPVADSLAPLPMHDLRVQLVRGTQAYADFASSKNAPERREPVSNIDGAIGILAGIAVDAREFEVANGVASAQK